MPTPNPVQALRDYAPGLFDRLHASITPERLLRYLQPLTDVQHRLRDWGVRWVAIKMDTRGAWVYDGERELNAHVPIYPARAVDGARPITTDDLLYATKRVIPISKVKPEEIEAMRNWGAKYALNASGADEHTEATARRGRKLEL